MSDDREARMEAQKVLGLRDDDGRMVPFRQMDRDTLLFRFQMMLDTNEDRGVAHAAEVKALERRLKDARNAKRLANARADRAEKAMRAMLDAFQEGEAS